MTSFNPMENMVMVNDIVKVYFGNTEAETEDEDEEVDRTYALLDRCEDLLERFGYDWDYDGWGYIVVSNDAFYNVILNDAELAESIEDYKETTNHWNIYQLKK